MPASEAGMQGMASEFFYGTPRRAPGRRRLVCDFVGAERPVGTGEPASIGHGRAFPDQASHLVETAIGKRLGQGLRFGFVATAPPLLWRPPMPSR